MYPNDGDHAEMLSKFTETSGSPNVSYVSIFSTVMNLLNSLLGAGILGVANSFTFCGFVPSVITITFVAFISFLSTWLVVKIQSKMCEESFTTMARIALGRFGGYSLTLASSLFCYACLTAFLMIGVNTLQVWCNIFGLGIEVGSWKYKILVTVYAISIPFALTLLKNMRFLSSFSTLSVVALLIFVVVICVKGIIYIPVDGIHPTVEISNMNLGFFNAMAIFLLTFSLAVVVLPLVRPMSPSIEKRTIAVGTAFVLCYLIVLIPSVIGYLIFGNEVKTILLDSFPADDIMMVIVRFSFFIIINASYPVLALTISGTVSNLIYKVENSIDLPFLKRLSVLCLVNIPPLLLSLFLPNVRPALSIGGAFGGCLCNTIYPPLIWIRISKERWYHWTNIGCMIFALFGVLSTVIATYESIVDAINEFLPKQEPIK